MHTFAVPSCRRISPPSLRAASQRTLFAASIASTTSATNANSFRVALPRAHYLGEQPPHSRKLRAALFGEQPPHPFASFALHFQSSDTAIWRTLPHSFARSSLRHFVGEQPPRFRTLVAPQSRRTPPHSVSRRTPPHSSKSVDITALFAHNRCASKSSDIDASFARSLMHSSWQSLPLMRGTVVAVSKPLRRRSSPSHPRTATTIPQPHCAHVAAAHRPVGSAHRSDSPPERGAQLIASRLPRTSIAVLAEPTRLEDYCRSSRALYRAL